MQSLFHDSDGQKVWSRHHESENKTHGERRAIIDATDGNECRHLNIAHIRVSASVRSVVTSCTWVSTRIALAPSKSVYTTCTWNGSSVGVSAHDDDDVPAFSSEALLRQPV